LAAAALPGGAGDVQVRPREVGGKALQELGRGDGAAGTSGDVGHVGEVALQAFGVLVVQRQAPDTVLRGLAGRCSAPASASSLENKPLRTPPSATTQAPVSVAMSITAAGSKRLA
jgi:hypothetical protein